MKKWTLVLIFILAGCKHGSSGGNNTPPDDDDPGGPPSYPFDFDEETPNGIMIETRGHNIPALSDIDNWYRQTQECLEIQFALLSLNFEDVEAPPIVIEDDLTNLCGTGSAGIYCTNFEPRFIGIQTAYANFAQRETWRHEFIHHILVESGIGPNHDWNRNHVPLEIWSCQSYDN